MEFVQSEQSIDLEEAKVAFLRPIRARLTFNWVVIGSLFDWQNVNLKSPRYHGTTLHPVAFFCCWFGLLGILDSARFRIRFLAVLFPKDAKLRSHKNVIVPSIQQTMEKQSMSVYLLSTSPLIFIEFYYRNPGRNVYKVLAQGLAVLTAQRASPEGTVITLANSINSRNGSSARSVHVLQGPWH